MGIECKGVLIEEVLNREVCVAIEVCVDGANLHWFCCADKDCNYDLASGFVEIYNGIGAPGGDKDISSIRDADKSFLLGDDPELFDEVLDDLESRISREIADDLKKYNAQVRRMFFQMLENEQSQN